MLIDSSGYRIFSPLYGYDAQARPNNLCPKGYWKRSIPMLNNELDNFLPQRCSAYQLEPCNESVDS